MAVLRPAGVYFALVFGAGFALGIGRTLWLVPAVGVRTAELLEMPLMLAVTVFAARWIVVHFRLATRRSRLAVGALALAVMVAIEIGMAYALQGLDPVAFVQTRDPVSGSVYAALLVLFGCMPALLGECGMSKQNERRPGVP